MLYKENSNYILSRGSVVLQEGRSTWAEPSKRISINKEGEERNSGWEQNISMYGGLKSMGMTCVENGGNQVSVCGTDGDLCR